VPAKCRDLKYRADIITQLSVKLLDSKLSRLVVIYGLKTIGKSCVAKNTFHFLAERKFFGHAIIWVQCSQKGKVLDLIQDLFSRIIGNLDLTLA